MGKRIADMTPEELERKRARCRRENMTPEQLERKRALDRARTLTPEQVEWKRARKRKENMTPEQLERKRALGRKENMTPEQLERQRAWCRARTMTHEQLERKRATSRAGSLEANARKAPDLEIFMLNKIDLATRSPNLTYRIPSICPPELAAKLAPVLERLKTADAAQRAVIRGVVRAMRAARELELAESVAQ